MADVSNIISETVAGPAPTGRIEDATQKPTHSEEEIML